MSRKWKYSDEFRLTVVMEYLSGRYGGEEFVSILKAGSMDEAYTRVDKARQQIIKFG